VFSVLFCALGCVLVCLFRVCVFGFVCGTSFCTSRVAPCCRLGGVVCVAGTRYDRMCVCVVSVDGTGDWV